MPHPGQLPAQGAMQRKVSCRGLADMLMPRQLDDGALHSAPSGFAAAAESTSSKRILTADQLVQPSKKRPRSDRPRIDYFPRIKAGIELHLASSEQTKALALLRQLKFLETTMFQGVNPYCDPASRLEPDEPAASDAEVILIDML